MKQTRIPDPKRPEQNILCTTRSSQEWGEKIQNQYASQQNAWAYLWPYLCVLSTNKGCPSIQMSIVFIGPLPGVHARTPRTCSPENNPVPLTRWWHIIRVIPAPRGGLPYPSTGGMRFGQLLWRSLEVRIVLGSVDPPWWDPFQYAQRLVWRPPRRCGVAAHPVPLDTALPTAQSVELGSLWHLH